MRRKLLLTIALVGGGGKWEPPPPLLLPLLLADARLAASGARNNKGVDLRVGSLKAAPTRPPVAITTRR